MVFSFIYEEQQRVEYKELFPSSICV